MDQFTERRAYVRIHPRAYACEKTCTLLVEGKTVTACLVDLSAGGARLKLSMALEGPKDQAIVFTLDDVPHKGRFSALPSRVRWRNGVEIGIQFDAPLDMGVSTLQKLIG